MSRKRCSGQILFKRMGGIGQNKTNQKCTLIIGMGALGIHVAEGLMRAGITKLIIVDRGYIGFNNLQRQASFTEEDALKTMPEMAAARRHSLTLRSDANIDDYINHVDYYFLEAHGWDIGVIIDATGSFRTRRLISDFVYKHRIPRIYGDVIQSTYTEVVFISGKIPCFNCLVLQLPTLDLTYDAVGVAQPAVTVTASLQLGDAIKVLTERPIDIKITYGGIWEGNHYSLDFSEV